MQRLDRHRLAVGETEPANLEHTRSRRGVQRAADLRAGADVLERDRSAVGHHPAPAHVLAERRQRQLLRDLRLADEGATAVAPREIPLADELIEGGAERQPRHAEVAAQPPLRGNRLADAELADQLHDLVADLLLLRHGSYG